MMNRCVFGIILGLLMLCRLIGAAQAQNTPLSIYLPREITVDNSIPTLGKVAILRGDQELTAKADVITLGYFSVPEQQIVIDRETLLSRLACNGIDCSNVAITGAEEVHISVKHQRITGDACINEATAFLEKSLSGKSICQIQPVRIPPDIILSGLGEQVRLSCRLIDQGRGNQCQVEVIVFQDDQVVSRQEIPFQFNYAVKKVVTQRPLGQGEVLTEENIRTEPGVSNSPQPPGWKMPYGLIAKRDIPDNTVITQNMVAPVQPEVLVKRNQTVAIKIESASLVASAIGKALQEGATGEYIRVQNVDSRVIIMAKINGDGTVEPIH